MVAWQEFFPSGSTGGINWGAIVLVFFLIIFFGILSIVIIVWAVNKFKWKYSIVVFSRVGKSIQPTAKDKAMFISLTKGGDQVLRLKKLKKIFPYPVIQTGANTYWYYLREDGEYINVGIEDVDLKMREFRARFLDKEIRYSRSALQKNMEERLKKVSFWEKWGIWIMGLMALLLLIILGFLWMNQWVKISSSVSGSIETAKLVMEKQNAILETIDRLCGGGLVPAS